MNFIAASLFDSTGVKESQVQGPFLKSHQSSHLWRYERHRMGEVGSQWVADRTGEADRRQAGQRHRRRDAFVIQHGNPDDPLRRVVDGVGLHVRGDLPLPFVPAVLKPDLHLGLGEFQRGGEPGSL